MILRGGGGDDEQAELLECFGIPVWFHAAEVQQAWMVVLHDLAFTFWIRMACALHSS